MRALFCALVLVAFAAIGCSSAPSQTSDIAHSADRHRGSLGILPAGPAVPPGSDEESDPDKKISGQEARRADRIVVEVCGIVTREVRLHEFPALWGETSKESRLAREYRVTVGSNVDAELERECPAYARLHSKNH